MSKHPKTLYECYVITIYNKLQKDVIEFLPKTISDDLKNKTFCCFLCKITKFNEENFLFRLSSKKNFFSKTNARFSILMYNCYFIYM